MNDIIKKITWGRMKNSIGFITLFTFFFAPMSDYAQVTINGPICAVPATVYQYTIAGNWDSTSTMTICVHGGAIADSADSNECTIQGAPLAGVLVTWDTSGSWSITVTSSKGNAVLNVSVVMPLSPGSIDSMSKTQVIGYDSVPAAITCSLDMGGSCSPSYSYQWQQSLDMVSWTDMPGDTAQNLAIDSALTQSKYYRRMVTEQLSGSVSYSDNAAVFVGGVTSWKDLWKNKQALCAGYNQKKFYVLARNK